MNLKIKKFIYFAFLCLFTGVIISLVLNYTSNSEDKKFTLPKLPYKYNALEPYIDALTMEIHYTKHHQKYVDELNIALEKHPDLYNKSLEELLKNLDSIPEDIRVSVRNNAGGHYNHSLFWQIMAPANNTISDFLNNKIEQDFGSLDKFKEQFSTQAKKLFGSGWVWLCIDKSGKLVIVTTPNQDTPLAQDLKPILCLDVWEHAYYLKYQNKRIDYIDAWWNIVNWPKVEELYKKSK